MRARHKRRCARCGKRHDIWIWVGDEIVCGVCATLEEFGGALGAVGSRPSHLRALASDPPDGSEGISGPREGDVCDWCKAAPKCNGTNPSCKPWEVSG